MSIGAFRDAYAYEAGCLTYGEQQTQGLSPGQYTQYFNITPRAGKSCALGAIFKFVGSLVITASAPLNSIPSASTAAAPDYPFVNGGSFDDLDLIIGNGGSVEISASPGAAARAQAVTRQFAEAIWAESTNTSFTVPTTGVASGYTTGNAGVAITVYLFVPVGGPAAAVRIKLAAAVSGAIIGQSVPVFASGATMSYTSVTSYIISSNFSGVAAFKEELTPSLGTSLQEFVRYVPVTVAPDFIFMAGDQSGNANVSTGTVSTVTQVLITDTGGLQFVSVTDTDVLELGAAAFAPIAGTTYCTKLGFVITGDQRTFQSFQLAFVYTSVHFIGYFQIAGGEDAYPNKVPAPVQGTPAVTQTGSVTASGQVAATNSGGGGGAKALIKGGSQGSIISRRSG